MIWPMIETPTAVFAVRDIAAHPRVAVLIMGTNDLAKELRSPIVPGRHPLVPHLATALLAGTDPGPPPLAEQGLIAVAHVESMLFHYGKALGLKNARKHVGWYLASSGRPVATVKAWRRRLCTEENPGRLIGGLSRYYAEAVEMAA